MNVQEIIALIEDSAPLTGAATWDRSGVQIAGQKNDVRKLAALLDPVPDGIAEALAWGADMILTHHPLYMEPRALDAPGDFLDVARMVLAHGSWLYAAHTSLDAQPEGPAGWLARSFKLSHVRVLEPTGAPGENVGLGIIGDLPDPIAWPRFAASLAECVERDFWTTSGEPPASIRTMAYCTGSGGSLVEAAKSAKADVYVTGDLKYHQALCAGIFLVDVGHFSLEEEMIRLFAKDLDSGLSPKGVAVKFFKGADPFTVHLSSKGPAPQRP